MSAAECILTVERCKAADERLPFGFNFATLFARRWSPSTYYEEGVRIRPATDESQTGLEYRSSGGTSRGDAEPRWPLNIDSGRTTCRDGAITYTAEVLSLSSLVERIASADWTVPAALTFIESAVVDEPAEQSTGGTISGGTLGETYDVACLVTTTEGNQYEARLSLTIV